MAYNPYPRFAYLFAVLLVLCVLGAGGIAAAPTVRITSPQAKAVVRGKITVQATASTDADFSYAVFYVNEEGAGATNTLPLRVQIDTALFPDGPHTFRVDLFDAIGVIASSLPLPIRIANGAPDDPEPTPARPAAPSNPAPRNTSHPPTPTTPPVPSVMLDGKPLELSESPFVREGRTMVMLRPLVEAAGGKLRWHGLQGTALINDQCIELALEQNSALIDDRTVMLDRPLILVNGRTFLPVTAWQHLFKGRVAYDPVSRCVILRSYEDLVRARLAR